MAKLLPPLEQSEERKQLTGLDSKTALKRQIIGADNDDILVSLIGDVD